MAPTATITEKPMSPAERRDLKAITEARFKQARSDLNVQIAEEVTRRQEAYDVRAAERCKTQTTKLVRSKKKMIDAVKAYEAEVEALEVEHVISTNESYRLRQFLNNAEGAPAVLPKGFGRRREQIAGEVRAIGNKAQNELERAKQAMLEDLLLGGIVTSEGRTFLGRIPAVDGAFSAAMLALPAA